MSSDGLHSEVTHLWPELKIRRFLEGGEFRKSLVMSGGWLISKYLFAHLVHRDRRDLATGGLMVIPMPHDVTGYSVSGIFVFPVFIGFGKAESPSERVFKEGVAASFTAVVERTAVSEHIHNGVISKLGFCDVPFGSGAGVLEEIPVLVLIRCSYCGPEPAWPRKPGEYMQTFDKGD